MSPDAKQLPSLEKYSATRLVRRKLIFCVLMNWNELQAYFTIAQLASTQNACYKAHTLLDMLKDPIVYLYFYFVSPLVTKFEE